MFNLIPNSVKAQILKDYKKRRGVLWIFGALVFSCTLLIFILPTYAYVLFEEKNMRIDAELVKNSSQLKKADEVVGTIKETNEQLKALSAIGNPIRPMDTIGKAMQVKDGFIHIEEIEYKEVTATTSSLVLKGVADRRESLREFVTKLEATKGFSAVVLPVSNFAKEKNIDFSISITLL